MRDSSFPSMKASAHARVPEWRDTPQETQHRIARLLNPSACSLDGYSGSARGLLILAGAHGAAIGSCVDRWELAWPGSVQAIAKVIQEVSAAEESWRSQTLGLPVTATEPSAVEVLCTPARMNVWLLEHDVLRALNVEPSGGSPGESAAADAWAQLLDDLASMVPPQVYCLDPFPLELARMVIFDMFTAELHGPTHGRCLLRIRQNHTRSPSRGGAVRPDRRKSGATT